MTAQPEGLVVAGAALILTGDSLKDALDAVLIAARTRTRNGLSDSTLLAIAKAIATAMSANGPSDVRSAPELQHYPQLVPTVTVADAAQQLNCTHRHVTRIAPKLGGKKIAGRWLLDQDAIDEHKEGQKWTETTSSSTSRH
jgi:hypothetical protein